MDTRTERIVLETDRHRIVGDITMPREGYRSRLSDYLNRGEMDFIPLANVVISAIDGSQGTEELDFIAVVLVHVQIAYLTNGSEPG